MVKFGPSGTGELFAKENLSKTIEAPSWLAEKNLDCFEYSFGRGVLIKEETAKKIGEEFRRNKIEISVHAPYFINLATKEEEKAVNNTRYILQSLKALDWLGGKRCVFHAGSPLKQDRNDAMIELMSQLEKIVQIKHEAGFIDKYLCVETMGKLNQLGDIDEIIKMCSISKDIIPCVDFGHLNARTQGGLSSVDDFCRVFDRFLEGVGQEKFENMHIHFSKIEYSKGGEVRHLTFDDKIFGPEVESFCQALSKYNTNAYVVCESSGTQTEDAIKLKEQFNNCKIM